MNKRCIHWPAHRHPTLISSTWHYIQTGTLRRPFRPQSSHPLFWINYSIQYHQVKMRSAIQKTTRALLTPRCKSPFFHSKCGIRRGMDLKKELIDRSNSICYHINEDACYVTYYDWGGYCWMEEERGRGVYYWWCIAWDCTCFYFTVNQEERVREICQRFKGYQTFGVHYDYRNERRATYQCGRRRRRRRADKQETDKATIDVEAQDDGVMGKILVRPFSSLYILRDELMKRSKMEQTKSQLVKLSLS